MTFSPGPFAFPPRRVMCSLPPFSFPPPFPPFLCPSKLRHVISHHKNRGGKTCWRYRCLRVSGTKAACKYSGERRSGERDREGERGREGGRQEEGVKEDQGYGDRKLKRETEGDAESRRVGWQSPWRHQRCLQIGAVIKVEMSSVYLLCF